MHAEAREWVARWATTAPVAVLDLGGRNINGTCRDLFPNARPYTVLDLRPGPGVDVVADAATWTPDRVYDLVLCTEVFEHTPDWARICRTAFKACAPGGRLIVTCAGPGRPAHSGIDGELRLLPGEHYANIELLTLYQVLHDCGWREIQVNHQGLDMRATALR